MIILKIIATVVISLFLFGMLIVTIVMLTAQNVLRKGYEKARNAQDKQAARSLHTGAEMVECPSCGTYVTKTPAFEKAGVCASCRKKKR